MKSHVSIEVAKKLAEAGYTGKADFWYVEDGDDFKAYYGQGVGSKVDGEAYPAPTVTNIFEASQHNLLVEDVFRNTYGAKRKDKKNQGKVAESPADAIALIWIEENK